MPGHFRKLHKLKALMLVKVLIITKAIHELGKFLKKVMLV